MAVIKLPRARKGVLSQAPPLSWPNDTAIGRRRPRLGLLRQATHNSRQHRVSSLSASSKHKVPMLAYDERLRSPAPRASGRSKYNAHTRTQGSSKQFTMPDVSGKRPKKNAKLIIPEPSPPTQPSKASQTPTNSLTYKKKGAKSQKHNHKAKPSYPPSPTSQTPLPSPTPSAPKAMDWSAYVRAKAHRLKQIRIWVHSLRRSHRIVRSVAQELMAYYGSEEKYGNHPSARSLSAHAWQAVRLCEHEFGTDLQWGKGLGEEVWGSECAKVEKLIGIMMEGERGIGMGTVGETDLSDEADDEEGEDDDEGFWGDGLDKDVQMADAA